MNTQTFIVFDGDIDALWIENMNSVMDDNKLLTLSNGERIKLKPEKCRLLFEVGDLLHASPATVSRAGMVYTNSESMVGSVKWTNWINNLQNVINVIYYLNTCLSDNKLLIGKIFTYSTYFCINLLIYCIKPHGIKIFLKLLLKYLIFDEKYFL